jgi:putative ABC transport system permease protein
MVSESLARRLWPGGSAIGQQLVVDYSTAGTYPYEVVGVVGDLRFRGPRSEPRPEIYLSHAQRSYLILNVVVRTGGDPRALVPALRDALHEIDPQKPAQGLHPLADLLGATYARDRQVMAILLLFAIAATVLAALGVYGVLSQRVRERSREIGIRMALGADAGGLVRLVAGAGLRLVAAGAAAGMMVAWMTSRALGGLLFGVAATDAATSVAVMAGVGVVGLLAAALPSWRATHVDPVTILRRG